MNISKKRLVLVIVSVLAILSTLFAYKTLADDEIIHLDDILQDEFVLELETQTTWQYSFGGYSTDTGYITLSELAQNVSLLCSQQSNIQGIFNIEDATIPVGGGGTDTLTGTQFRPGTNWQSGAAAPDPTLAGLFPQGLMDLLGQDEVELTYEEIVDLLEQYGEGAIFTGKVLAKYHCVASNVPASPKEAYILSEMSNLSPHVGIYYDFETDGDGNRIPVDALSGYFNLENRFELGEEEFFFGRKKWVTATGTGDALGEGTYGPSGTYEWVKVVRRHGTNSGIVETISKTGVTYTWSEPITEDFYDSGIDTFGGGEGSGTFVPGDVVVHIEDEGYYKVRLMTGGNNIQIAWWTTVAGGGPAQVDSGLAAEAQAFEDYILDISGGELKRTYAQWEAEDGKKYDTNYAFDFEYKPTWVTGGEYDNVTVKLEEDTDTIVIGPFAIDYYEAHFKTARRNYVTFAGITKMELYTDASEEPLEYGENHDWKIVWLKGEREKPSEYKYPMPKEKFYIRLKNYENATKITDFKVYFKYMNAAGAYSKYEGTFEVQYWTIDVIPAYKHAIDPETGELMYNLDGTPKLIPDPDHNKYVFKKVSAEEPQEAQILAVGHYGARWYNYCELNRTIKIRSGKLRITKDLIDYDGQVINESDPDRLFHFTVHVNGGVKAGDPSHGDEWLEVKPGKYADSAVYYWAEGEDAPTFKVTEDESDDYQLVSMEIEGQEPVTTNSISGTLEAGNTILVRAVNKLEHRGRIAIVKKLYQSQVPEVAELIGQDFHFTLKVTGTFWYDGVKYDENSEDPNVKKELVLDVTAKAEGEPWYSGDFIWYGNEEPKYIATENTEQNPQGTRLLWTTNASGRIKDEKENRITVVVFTNMLTREFAKIKIIKTLENANLYEPDEIMSKVFHFRVDIYNRPEDEGYPNAYDKPIYLDLTAKRQGNKYVWEGETGYFYWYYGHNKQYKITEYDNPEGTSFVQGENNEGVIFYDDSVVTGTLVSKREDKYTVENKITNKIEIPNKGKIDITKRIDSDSLKGETFKFILTVTGSFEYDGQKYGILAGKEGDETVQFFSSKAPVVIENDNYDKDRIIIKVDEHENTWESKEFTWYGTTAPKFKVMEDAQGQDVKFSVEPGEGFLQPEETLHVTAINSDLRRAGRLEIIKKIKESQYITEEYVKTLSFKFHVTIDGYLDTYYTLTSEDLTKEGDEWVWRKQTGRISWNEDDMPEGQTGPHYVVEEVIEGDEATLESSENADDYLIDNDIQTIEFKTTKATFINKLKEHKGKLSIEKIATTDMVDNEFEFVATIKGAFFYEGKFYNELEIKDIKIKVGDKWTSEEFTWYGDEAPEYSTIEKESPIAKNVNIINGSGKLVADQTQEQTAIFENEEYDTNGYLQITKLIADGTSSDEKFTFEVKVARQGESLDEAIPEIVTLKANESYVKEMTWKVTEDAPRYSVREINIPDGFKLKELKASHGEVKGDTVTGSFIKDGETVNVVAINEEEEHEGQFKVIKAVIADAKRLPFKTAKFSFRASITGDFEIEGHSVTGNSTEYLNFTLEVDMEEKQATYTSPVIKWKGEKAPIVKVEETSMPTGWHLVGISSNNNPVVSQEGEPLVITVTNQFDILPHIDITIELAGDVWEDVPFTEEEKQTENTIADGKFNPEQGEVGIPGVKVYVYDANDQLVTIYDDFCNGVVPQPIITDSDGHWDAPRIKLEKEKFKGHHVVFVYDGQTYEPTKFLASSKEGNASEYMTAPIGINGRDKYANDSMAKDMNRDEVNNRMAVISGKSEMNGYGDTTGTATSTNGNTSDLYYKSTSMGSINGSKRRVSELQTKDENGDLYSIFEAKAGTKVAGLTYPFDNNMHLVDYDASITELGLEETYYYSATYNYCLHINLGLVRREEADLSATKDLFNAKVVSNNKLQEFKFNKLADIGADSYSRQLYSDSNNIEYQLGVYNTDYYYRAELYQTNRVFDKIQNLYKDIEELRQTELEVFLTYKLTLYNESPSYKVQIGSINDYFDSTFGEPVNKEIKRTIIDDKGNKSEVVVAKGSYYGETEVNWKVTDREILSSDGVKYNKMEADLGNLELKSGESVDIYVTFQVEKGQFNGVFDSVQLGNKSNIVEIAKYSTFYADGALAGKVDGDSAPDNINIVKFNNKDWYEDDTDAAPVLKLEMERDTRSIVGTAWEDRDGQGVLDNNEAKIGGLTVELIEKVNVDGTEYDFIWPTNKQMSILGGRTLEELTGFDSTTETSRLGNNVGEYSFVGIPVGRYAVRFLYGNNKLDLPDTFGITGDATALKDDGTNYSGKEEILPANYKNYNVGKAPAVYNGQDYKSAVYQEGYRVVDANGYLTNKYHNLKDEGLANARVSDARDSESRRLDLISKSETMMNTIGEILASANDKDANHNKLYAEYSMFADTAILDLTQLEGTHYAGLERTVSTQTAGSTGVSVEAEVTNYKAKNIDFALTERPENEIVLDKEIKSITLTSSDNRVIFRADYDISYEVLNGNNVPEDRTVIAEIDGGFIVAKVELKDTSVNPDILQAINKSEVKLSNRGNVYTQNFRYINVDDVIMQGATIKIDYLITALNVGEADYTSKTLAEIASFNVPNKPDALIKDKLLYLAKIKGEEDYTRESLEIGKYLGSAYYTGDNSKDEVVKTRVRQLIDYVDNDAIFAQEDNTKDNHNWRTTTITEMLGNGDMADVLVSSSVMPEYRIIDKDGIDYITENRRNIIISSDSSADYVEDGPNAGFSRELVPYEINPDGYKSQIELTVTKTIAAQDDMDSLTFDNIAEIVKLENNVGRRDVASVPGNANPKGAMINDEFEKGEFAGASLERDASATELVTFSPPTGIEAKAVITTEVLIMVAIALIVVVVGIVIIKKKLL